MASGPKGIGELTSPKFPIDGVPLALLAGGQAWEAAWEACEGCENDIEHVAEVKWVTRIRGPDCKYACLLAGATRIVAGQTLSLS